MVVSQVQVGRERTYKSDGTSEELDDLLLRSVRGVTGRVERRNAGTVLGSSSCQ